MIIPVILAGGSGTRLWPFSRELHPKQLLTLTGQHTMLQQTLLRLAGAAETDPPMIICNGNHRFMVDRQLSDIGIRPSAIVLEPMGRNTAPAVTVAALKAVERHPEALMLVLPADHLIKNVPAFHAALAAGERYAAQGRLVTFGIVPDRPETGYGYIRKGAPADVEGKGTPDAAALGFAIAEFVEKPDMKTARGYVDSGDYCWNSGMFLFPAAGVLAELRRFAPEIVASCERALAAGMTEDGFFRLDPGAFAACPSDSIDYAVMEKTRHGVMIPLDAGWDDVGSWEALWKVGEKDVGGNAVSGDVICVRSENTLVRADNRLVTVLGVKNLAVVETRDAVLVSALSDTQGVKQIVDRLKSSGRPETRTHLYTVFPWGNTEILDAGDGAIVRKITVLPGASFALPGHACQCLTWMVVTGTASLCIAGSGVELAQNDSIRVAPGEALELENPGPDPLVLLEVAFGHPQGPDHFALFQAPLNSN